MKETTTRRASSTVFDRLRRAGHVARIPIRWGRLHQVVCDVAVAAASYAGTGDLRPVVLAQNQRETEYISSHMGAAKMCFDWVHYASAADDADAPVAEEYELEVELRQGSRSVVVEIAQRLSRGYGLAPQTQSKYEQGAALTGGFPRTTLGGASHGACRRVTSL